MTWKPTQFECADGYVARNVEGLWYAAVKKGDEDVTVSCQSHPVGYWPSYKEAMRAVEQAAKP